MKLDKNSFKAKPVEATGSFSQETPGSEQVKKIEYNGKTKVFTIHFKATVYDYFDVPIEVANKASKTNSFGALPRNELKGFKFKKRD